MPSHQSKAGTARVFVGKWMDKLWYSPTVEHCVALERKQILTPYKLGNLRSYTRRISQTQDEHLMILLL